jgi:hypothetical protein
MMSEGQEMRLAFLSGLILIAAAGGPVLAQGACTVAGTPYASGASLCQPAVRDGRIEQMLFTCENGAWTNANAVCPDEYSYFCRIGAHAVPVGETLLLGAGPARLECQFPGVLQLVQGSDPGAAGTAPSMLVRGVQLFAPTAARLEQRALEIRLAADVVRDRLEERPEQRVLLLAVDGYPHGLPPPTEPVERRRPGRRPG